MADSTASSTSKPDIPSTKSFTPLESSPTILTSLSHTLGLSPALSFHDIFSLTDPDLLAIVPRPVSALLLCFPVSEVYERHRREEDVGREGDGRGGSDKDGGGDDDDGVVWFKQTIRNACGVIGVVHALGNGSAREQLVPNSTLDKLLKQAINLPAKDRADLLYNSSALEAAHQSAASKGQSAAPEEGEDVDLHYVCFVRVEASEGQGQGQGQGKLYELDGRRKGPICRGVLGEGEDVLSDKAIEMGPMRFLRREEEEGKEGELRFGLLALGPSVD